MQTFFLPSPPDSVLPILTLQAGNYTPESSVEHPGAVEQLAEEYARAGGDITQTFTFYSRDVGTPEGCNLTVRSGLNNLVINILCCSVVR